MSDIIVRVTPFDHKSKMRIIEHGDKWRIEATARVMPGMVLLSSCQTGYLKWWKRENTTTVNDSI